MCITIYSLTCGFCNVLGEAGRGGSFGGGGRGGGGLFCPEMSEVERDRGTDWYMYLSALLVLEDGKI